MFPTNFTPNFQVPKQDLEQNRQTPKMRIHNDGKVLLPEHIPTLGANLDLSQSIDFGAVNARSVNQQNSFYTQWEVDIDDYEDKKILEDLRVGNKLKFYGNAQDEESFFPSPCNFSKENDSYLPNKGLKAHQTGTYEPSTNNTEAMMSSRQIAVQEVETRNVALRKQIETSKAKKLSPIPETRAMDSPGLLRPERAVSYNAMGETIESEFIQCPLALDKDSEELKCSKNSSSREEKQQPVDAAEQKTQTTGVPETRGSEPGKLISIQEETKEKVTGDGGNDEGDESLKNSSLISLQRRITEGMEKFNHAQFNVMVVGAASLGKSTFIDAFLNRRYNVTGPIRASTSEITEIEGVRNHGKMSFKIKMIDTPGYSSKGNMQKWYGNIEKYIIRQFHSYKEAKKNSKQMKKPHGLKEDKRVNIILYFLTGPRICEEDLIYMKRLQQYSNLVPIIAKSDCYTIEEVKKIKQQFQEDVHNHKIELFDFAEALKSNPKKLKQLQEGIFGPCPPFMIASSIKKIEISPKRFIYGRQYPWGLCNVEDPNHSDFVLLQTLLSGYIYLEACELTRFYYKDYFRRYKAARKAETEKENTAKVGFGVAVALGLVGAYLTLDKKLFR